MSEILYFVCSEYGVFENPYIACQYIEFRTSNYYVCLLYTYPLFRMLEILYFACPTIFLISYFKHTLFSIHI